MTDTLFKSCDVATRQAFVALCESVREHGGRVRVFSSLHVSGEQLAQVSGIAAILRFPMPEEEVLDDGAAESDDGDDNDGAFGGDSSNMVFTVGAAGGGDEDFM